MSGMVPTIAAVAIFFLLAGVALGWYLRRANAWCPRCGGALRCRGCGERPHSTGYRANQRWGR